MSFVLAKSGSSFAGKRHGADLHLQEVQDKFGVLLSRFLLSLQALSAGSDQIRLLYEDCCLLCLSRLLQTNSLRPLLATFLGALPSIPPSSVSLLKLLMCTGSKHSALPPPTGGRLGNTRETASQVGTRQEALQQLCRVVFCADRSAGLESLRFLLWCAVAEDFELRSKSANLIAKLVLCRRFISFDFALIDLPVREIFGVEEWADRLVVRFALHAVCGVIGSPSMCRWAAGGNRSHTHLSPGEPDASGALNFSMGSAFESFDGGEAFGGAFPTVPAAADNDREFIERHAKQSINLLVQLCLVDVLALGAFVDIFCAAASNVDDDVSSAPVESGAERRDEKESTAAGRTCLCF